MCVSTCKISDGKKAHYALVLSNGKIFLIRLNGSGSQVHLTDVVEVSMRDFFLRRQLFHLIEQDVHLELGAEVLQTAVAERLSVATKSKAVVVSVIHAFSQRLQGTRKGCGLLIGGLI